MAHAGLFLYFQIKYKRSIHLHEIAFTLSSTIIVFNNNG